jgi:hypothetical protein
MAQPQILSPLLPTKLIHQFPLPTWVENLAIRSNGQILVTLLTTPELYLLDPTTTPPTSTFIHKFPSALALTGIIELGQDIFYICAGSFNVSAYKNEPGSYSVYEVDMRGFKKEGDEVQVKKICDIKESGLLNGMELFSEEATEVLIADSEVGCVWKVNVGTGEYEMVVQVDEMKVPAQGMPMGINGIKIRDGYLYWTNTGRKQFCRIKIDHAGKAIGKTEIVAEDCLGDDFVFDKEGNAWIAQNPLNTVAVVRSNGEMTLVAGKKEELEVCGGTSCQFGKGKDEEHILYVATSGALAEPVNGDKVEGGKVVAVDTSRFYS